MIKTNGKWFHDSSLEVGTVYTISRMDSMSLDVGEKYIVTASTPATVTLPNFGATSGAFVEIRKATSEEIESADIEIKARAANWQNYDGR
jgi:hypothetical protein